MRIGLCDDIKSEQVHFLSILKMWDPTRNVECFFDGKSLLDAAKVSPPFDIVFLDIYLLGENGIDVASELLKISPKTEIVFVTTSEDYAINAFKLNALHYLVKPVTLEGIIEVFRRLNERQIKSRPKVTFSLGHGTYTYYLDDIIFLLSCNHAVDVFFTDGKQVRVWEPLKEIELKLDNNFLKVNRSTIVNMEHITYMDYFECVMKNGERFDISRQNRVEIRSTYDKFLFSRLSERNPREA